MKNIGLLIAVFTFFILSPTPAHAELQCFTGPGYTESVSVQNRAQCAAYDPSGAVYDTVSKLWQNSSTGNAIYNPIFTCVGLPPAYRTSSPSADGGCTAGYKLGQIVKDAAGNISKINYSDGSVGDLTGNYTPPPAANTATLSGTGRNPNAFCTGGSCTYVPLEPLPGLPTSYGPNKGSFPNLVSSSFRLLIGAGGLVAIVMIVLGALTYMFSDVVGNKKKALDRIRGAMWGIVLLVSSYLILVTINPELVSFNLNLAKMNNFNTATDPQGALTQTQSPPPQAELNSCNQLCPIAGGTVRANAAGGYTCQCITSATPI